MGKQMTKPSVEGNPLKIDITNNITMTIDYYV